MTGKISDTVALGGSYPNAPSSSASVASSAPAKRSCGISPTRWRGGEISLSEFQTRLAAEVKNLHVSGAMAGQGGPANMTREDYLRVGRALKVQYRQLGRFAEQIGRGELTATQIRQRTEMYVRSQNSAYEGGRRATAMAAGYLYEKNVLGKNENHCHSGPMREGCIDVTALGWVEIGTLALPGSRACLSNCMCSLTFRKMLPTNGA